MSLRDEIFDDFKTAMKQQEKDRLQTLRMLKSAIQSEEKEQGEELDDEAVIKVLSGEVKSRRESIEQYEEGGREDLAEQERAEVELIQSYMPDPLSDEELDELIEEVIEETGAEDLSDMGAVMGRLMPKIQGRADGSTAQERVREELS